MDCWYVSQIIIIIIIIIVNECLPGLSLKCDLCPCTALTLDIKCQQHRFDSLRKSMLTVTPFFLFMSVL